MIDRQRWLALFLPIIAVAQPSADRLGNRACPERSDFVSYLASERDLESKLARLNSMPELRQTILKNFESAFDQLPRPSGERLRNALRRIGDALGKLSSRPIVLKLVSVDETTARSFTLQTYEDRIIVNVAWLESAMDDDIAAAVAHELGHRTDDYLRRLILDAFCTREGATDLEISADSRAIELLQRAGYDPAVLIRFLERDPRVPSARLVQAKHNARRPK